MPEPATWLTYMLRVVNLTYRYPDSDAPALRDLSLSLEPGEVLLVAGGMGSGKSTLCYALAGFVPHFFQGEMEGDVYLEGRSLRGASLGEWIQQVGLVVQNPFNQITGARMTVFGEVAFGLENLGVPRAEIGRRVGSVLQQLGIAELAERSPYALSGGQMQRVAIASILALHPRLLIMDEPTAQLDPEGTREVFQVVRVLAEQGASVVLATHKLTEVAEFATRALVLHDGTIALEADTQTVLSDPRLAGWSVEPPVFVVLATEIGLPEPAPTTFSQAVEAFSSVPYRGDRERGDHKVHPYHRRPVEERPAAGRPQGGRPQGPPLPAIQRV
ncbi:MAG: energy-coupling factor ABC transporter ATP-binding protein, partial [Ardenticatenaceae bacterium]